MTRLDLLAACSLGGALVFFGVATVAALRLDVSALGTASRHRERAPGFPRDVALPDGKTFHVESKPERIIASSARLIDFCAALVPPERIAAYAEQAIEYTTLGAREAEFRDRPRFRDYLAEPVMSLEPDLVLADPWQSADTRTRLSDAGIPVLVLPNSVTWREMCDALSLLGEVLGEEESAAREVSSIEARIEALRARSAGKKLRAVPYSNFGSQGFSAGRGTTIDEAMGLAGIVNVVAEDGGNGHLNVSFEALIDLDPEAIVVSLPLNAPSGHTGDKGGASELLLCGEESLRELRAVRERRFLRVSAGLYASGSHGIVRAAEVLADERDRVLREIAESEPTGSGGGSR